MTDLICDKINMRLGEVRIRLFCPGCDDRTEAGVGEAINGSALRCGCGDIMVALGCYMTGWSIRDSVERHKSKGEKTKEV